MSSPPAKNILVSFFRKSCLSPAHPASCREGRTRRHDTRGRGVVAVARSGAFARKTADVVADGQAVWSWRPEAGAKLAITFVRGCERRGQTSRSPGRARSSRENHRAGKAGSLRLNLWFLPRAFSPHGATGLGRGSVFPAPSRFERRSISAARAHRAARTRSHVLTRRISSWPMAVKANAPREEGPAAECRSSRPRARAPD